MADGEYVVTRIDYLRDPITAQRAREMFEQAQAREGAELTGDLERGFEFYVAVGSEGERLVRYRVEPVTPR